MYNLLSDDSSTPTFSLNLLIVLQQTMTDGHRIKIRPQNHTITQANQHLFRHRLPPQLKKPDHELWYL